MIGELKKAIFKILELVGLTAENFEEIRCVFIAAGDGLTFERFVQLQNYMQFQDTEFARLDFLKPLLESWHTLWTNLSRIYEAHWDSLTSKDPSAIGPGANLLNLKAPANLSKVDFYKYNKHAKIDRKA